MELQGGRGCSGKRQWVSFRVRVSGRVFIDNGRLRARRSCIKTKGTNRRWLEITLSGLGSLSWVPLVQVHEHTLRVPLLHPGRELTMERPAPWRAVLVLA